MALDTLQLNAKEAEGDYERELVPPTSAAQVGHEPLDLLFGSIYQAKSAFSPFPRRTWPPDKVRSLADMSFQTDETHSIRVVPFA